MINLPPATKTLLAANVVVFAVMLLFTDQMVDEVELLFGFVPARYGAGVGPLWAAIVDPVTYQFLHGSLTHIGVNMLGLVAFGAGVEPRLGPWRFLLLYFVCGIVGAFGMVAIDPASSDPMIGASAAISGLFGAILRFSAFRRGFWVIVALWLILNVVTGFIGVGGMPVAWQAHIGGFFTGMVLFPLLARRPIG